jgi:hypothetical protein
MTINAFSLKTLLIYRINGYDIKTGVTDIFNIFLIKEVIDYKGFKHIIKTINPLLYGLLYNLSEL